VDARMRSPVFRKIVLCSIFVVALCIVYSINGTALASCDEYLKEAEAVEGVVPRFNGDGTIRAFVIFGEGTFLTAKKSLISKARRKAELRAKRAFSEWMKESLESESVVAEMMEQEENTDEKGNTSGKVKELEAQIDVMRSNTKAVLSGIIKLDECVDTSQKFVLVTLGWKPSLSKAAGKAKRSIDKAVKRGETTATGTRSTAAKQKTGKRNTSSSKRTTDKGQIGKASSGIRIVIVEVEGSGTNLRNATNDALRSAVSQIFGEQFAANIKSSELTETVEVSSSGGTSVGVAVETSSTQTEMSSKTKGLIQSYEYIRKGNSVEGISVFLRVKLPKFESAIDPTKSTIIVLRPKISSTLSGRANSLNAFRGSLQDNIVEVINRSKKLAVLDRRFLKDQANELRLISSGNSPVAEMARIGNTAGADLMFITEITSFSQNFETRKVGNTTIKRSVFDSEVSIKLIDVATTNIVFSKRIVFRKRKFKSSNPVSMFGKQAGIKIGLSVARKVGGGVIGGASSFGKASKRKSLKEMSKRADKQFNKAKKKVKDDW
jgi:hypothetical protein